MEAGETPPPGNMVGRGPASAKQLTPLQMKRIGEACQAQSHIIAAMQRKMNVLEAAVVQEACFRV